MRFWHIRLRFLGLLLIAVSGGGASESEQAARFAPSGSSAPTESSAPAAPAARSAVSAPAAPARQEPADQQADSRVQNSDADDARNAETELVYYLDKERQLEFRLRVNARERQLSGFFSHLTSAPSHRNRVLEEAIRNGLRIEFNGRRLAIQSPQAGEPGFAVLVAHSLRPSPSPQGLQLSLCGVPLMQTQVDLQGNQVQIAAPVVAREMLPYDTRQFGTRGSAYQNAWRQLHRNPTPPVSEADYRRIDLHTHFDAIIAGPRLVEVAEELGLPYPAVGLDRLGIAYPRDAVTELDGIRGVVVSRQNLGQAGLSRLSAALRVDPTQVTVFQRMEAIYDNRDPLMKNPRALERWLLEIAQEYQRQGVRYIEPSVARILRPEILARVERALPEIEATTGVRMRFLAGIPRTANAQSQADFVARIQALGPHPYLAGVDFMGHEINSTRDFAATIRALAEYRRTRDPGFQIRVHAGENQNFQENVRLAVEAGATRIGHGLYGVDDATLRLLRERGTIVEFNLNSNVALNNVRGVWEVPIRRYLNAGVRVTLGTDGPGVYTTSAGREHATAGRLGLTQAEVGQILESDARYLQGEYQIPPLQTPEGTIASGGVGRGEGSSAPAPEAPPGHSHPHELSSRSASQAGRGIEWLSAADLAHRVGQRQILFFNNLSAEEWRRLVPRRRESLSRAVTELLRNVDPERVLLITNGTRSPLDEMIHRIAVDRGIGVVGLLRVSAPSGETGNIGRAVRVQGADRIFSLREFFRAQKVAMIASGGGSAMADEILSARSNGVDVFLLRNTGGATDAARGPFVGVEMHGARSLLISFSRRFYPVLMQSVRHPALIAEQNRAQRSSSREVIEAQNAVTRCRLRAYREALVER